MKNKKKFIPLPRLLRFGIPSLDRLFYPDAKAKADGGFLLRPINTDKKEQNDPTDLHVSICITGPSGTGKSLLGLHLASRYSADCAAWRFESGKHEHGWLPKVLYVSTDLGLELARATWAGFGLDRPWDRKLPFEETLRGKPSDELPDTVELAHFSQEATEHLAEFINHESGPEGGPIAFVDLAEETAGDDWGFITRIVAQLPDRTADQPHHMLIIDAVEGLEMLTGETDSFGQPRSRRSRIAQILRSAAKKCHVVLILEEDNSRLHPAEEYVTDIVIRLRAEREMGYLRRSLEVVKARGQPLVRGEHHYVIRGSRGPTSALKSDGTAGLDFYPDDPAWAISYIQVIRSLHSLSRVMMHRDSKYDPGGATDDTTTAPELACFATPKFGSILQSVPETLETQKAATTRHGLVRGKVTSLIGDEATLKSRLGRAFLAGMMCHDPQRHDIKEAALLITTFNLHKEELISRMLRHLGTFGPQKEAEKLTTERKKLAKANKNRIICRQLEIHHLNSTLLFHLIRRCVEGALIALAGEAGTDAANRERARFWCDRSLVGKHLRVVIDDWAVIQSTHPEIASDRLFLPFLIKYFQRVGVTALIIATQPGRPEEILASTSEQQLRALSDYHLYTWHVPFYGTDRIAIAAVPPMQRSARASVGELREARPADGAREDDCVERLWIDPHFEQYKGLEKQAPQPVPAQVRLFCNSYDFDGYANQTRQLLQRLFGEDTEKPVLIIEGDGEYVDLRDYSVLHGNTQRDYTVVIQVDEYWKETGGKNTQATDYLKQRTTSEGHGSKQVPSTSNDPFLLYQKPSSELKKDIWWKHQYFDIPGYELPAKSSNSEQSSSPRPPQQTPVWVEKATGVPYFWDFGFLLLRVRAWKGAMRHLPGSEQIIETPRGLVTAVFRALTGDMEQNTVDAEPPDFAHGDTTTSALPESTASSQGITWEQFFRACDHVASWHNRPHWPEMQMFDLDMLTPQSFACLVLEMWASELRLLDSSLANSAFPKTRHSDEGHKSNMYSLEKMLDPDSSFADSQKFRDALFRVWVLLAEVLNSKDLTTGMHRLVNRKPTHSSVAERHWYSTGSLAWKDVGGDNPVIPARLPGAYTTRGDWFLVVGRESRSIRLGDRIIDLLCRRRANVERLEAGVGLPVRKLNRESWSQPNSDQAQAETYKEVLTAMVNFPSGGRRRIVRYGDFLKNLGAKDPGLGGQPHFQWLWRSRIIDYHRHDRAWEKWLGRLLVESTKRMQELRVAHHVERFATYAIVIQGNSNETDKSIWESIDKARKAFDSRCRSLVSELSQQPGDQGSDNGET